MVCRANRRHEEIRAAGAAGSSPVYAGRVTQESAPTESLSQFGRSLSYGSRPDLSFKFMARFDDDDTGALLAEILEEAGDLLDTGDPQALIDMVTRRQAEAYGSRPVTERYRYDRGPFQAPERPMALSKVALLTSSGHFVAGDDPEPFGIENMTQSEAMERISDFMREAPQLSSIPVDTPASEMRVRHGGYDIRGAVRDHNVALPLDALRAAAAAGSIGSLHDRAYSFVGAASQGRIVKESAPEWAEMLLEAEVDVVLLVPV